MPREVASYPVHGGNLQRGTGRSFEREGENTVDVGEGDDGFEQATRDAEIWKCSPESKKSGEEMLLAHAMQGAFHRFIHWHAAQRHEQA